MKRHIALRLLYITICLFVVYILAISASYHIMSLQANMDHHQNVVFNDAANIAEHYAQSAFPGDVPGADYFLTLEDVTHGRLYISDGGEGVYRLDENNQVTYCTLCQLPPAVSDGVLAALEGKPASFKNEEEGETYLYACAPIPEKRLALVLRTNAKAIGDAVVSDTQLILVSGLLSLAVAGILAYFAMRGVTRPLVELKRVADRLSDGDYSARSGINRADELGSLAGTMDELAEGMRLAEEQRAEMKRQQDIFLSEVSHELKTPVTVMCASVEALKNGVADSEEKRALYFERMERESEWLKKLVTDLLELTRLKNTSFSVEKREMTISDLLSDVAMTGAILAEKRGVRLVCEEPQSDCSINGDYGRLRQMLLNVLDNAMKFSPKGGTVEMTADCGAHAVVIRDRGPGIAPEKLNHLFERYTRRENETEGTGLGLAIAKQIAVRHGIEIGVKSQAGFGTEFSFDFSGALSDGENQ